MNSTGIPILGLDPPWPSCGGAVLHDSWSMQLRSTLRSRHPA